MCLRERLRQTWRTWLERFTGEHTAARQARVVPYARDLGEDPNRSAARARIPRPTRGTRPDEPPEGR